MTKLQAKNIVKHFDHNGNTILALDGINLNVEEGDLICIVGPSGCVNFNSRS
jgi:ABC-type sugar transport system ATPase subunit